MAVNMMQDGFYSIRPVIAIEKDQGVCQVYSMASRRASSNEECHGSMRFNPRCTHPVRATICNLLSPSIVMIGHGLHDALM